MTKPQICPTCGSNNPKVFNTIPDLTDSWAAWQPCDNKEFHTEEDDYNDWVGNTMPLSSLIDVEPEEGVE